jgi:transposase-like protein
MIQSKSWRALVYGKKRKKIRTSRGNDGRETMQDIYGFEASEGFISDVTDKILPQIEEWQNRPLSAVYPIIFIDAIHFSVREDSIVHKVAAVPVCHETLV